MTFSTKLKEEIVSNKDSSLILESELSAIIRYDALINKDLIHLSFENGAIARRVYCSLKLLFKVPINITIRNQKRLRSKQIYILEINNNVLEILNQLRIYKNNRYHAMDLNYLEDEEEIMGFVRGAFLANGSISDPATSGYHLEFVFNQKSEATLFSKLLRNIKFNSKVLKRNNRFMVYIKASEEISDMLRFFQAPNSLFYFEDIRIYRDHKNMLNRLNNCDIANQEKTTKTGDNQVKQILYLKEHDLYTLLDEKTQVVADSRLKYPDCSYQELAQIISLEYDYKIGKSGINHHFIKIKKLVEEHQKNANV